MENISSLSQLQPGMRAVVVGLSAEKHLRGQLQGMGFNEGAVVTCLRRSPLGDPTAYAVRGAAVALRAVDAAVIAVLPREAFYE